MAGPRLFEDHLAGVDASPQRLRATLAAAAVPAIGGLLVLVGLYLTSLHSYLLFHAIAELFSIVVGVGIFLIVWNARRFIDNSALLFIGIAYLFVAGVDLLHTLSYKGMGVFAGAQTNTAAQLWVAARATEAVSLLIAPGLLGRKLRLHVVLGAYALLLAGITLCIFHWGAFPACYVEGRA